MVFSQKITGRINGKFFFALTANDLAYANVAQCGRKCVDRHIFDHAGAKATITDTVGYGA